MSTEHTHTSLGIDFFAANRAMQRAFAARLDKIRKEHFTLRPDDTDRLSLKLHELEALQAILECASSTDQNTIADFANINKPAFSRTIKNLSEKNLIRISDETTIELTEQGREAAVLFKSEVDNIVTELAQSPEAHALTSLIARHHNL